MQLKRYEQQVYGATESVSDTRTVCASKVEAYSLSLPLSVLQVAIRAAEVIKRNRKLWQHIEWFHFSNRVVEDAAPRCR